MKDQPILFSTPTVRALLDGTKTQTRHVVKPRDLAWMDEHQGLRELDNATRCPYGQPGDRLWVRETHAPQENCWGSWERWLRGAGGEAPILHYSADFKPFQNDSCFVIRKPFIEKWRPSIHMPRWACRIDLKTPVCASSAYWSSANSTRSPRASGRSLIPTLCPGHLRAPIPTYGSRSPAPAAGTPTRGYGWSSSGGSSNHACRRDHELCFTVGAGKLRGLTASARGDECGRASLRNEASRARQRRSRRHHADCDFEDASEIHVHIARPRNEEILHVGWHGRLLVGKYASMTRPGFGAVSSAVARCQAASRQQHCPSTAGQVAGMDSTMQSLKGEQA
jgi:hypothetical protein